MTIEQQKAIADDVLERLHVLDPHCIVAGGAPRDWYCGKEATDIDVFVYVDPSITFTTFYNMLNKLGFTQVEVLDGKNISEHYTGNPELVCVYNVGGYDTPVQIMRMNSSTYTSVVPNFPLNLCKVWYKQKRIRANAEFYHGMDKKFIVLSGELYNNKHQYITKIKNKFPDFTFYDSIQDYHSSMLRNEYRDLMR